MRSMRSGRCSWPGLRISRTKHHWIPRRKRSPLMERLKGQSRRQLVLSLEREVRVPPIAQGSEALLQALADLLLGALGQEVEERASETGGADEPEDHA